MNKESLRRKHCRDLLAVQQISRYSRVNIIYIVYLLINPNELYNLYCKWSSNPRTLDSDQLHSPPWDKQIGPTIMSGPVECRFCSVSLYALIINALLTVLISMLLLSELMSMLFLSLLILFIHAIAIHANIHATAIRVNIHVIAIHTDINAIAVHANIHAIAIHAFIWLLITPLLSA